MAKPERKDLPRQYLLIYDATQSSTSPGPLGDLLSGA
jgi:hypothetical protein